MSKKRVEWPPNPITIALPWEEAVVLYELVDRFQESEKREFSTDRAEWYALILLAGHLERGGAEEIPDYQRVLTEAREELGSYDGIPNAPWDRAESQ